MVDVATGIKKTVLVTFVVAVNLSRMRHCLKCFPCVFVCLDYLDHINCCGKIHPKRGWHHSLELGTELYEQRKRAKQ